MKKNGLHVDTIGNQYWYKDDKIHREDGPAITWNDGGQFWYKEDKLHREYGPAVIWANGTEFWYKEGKPYTPSAHELMVWKMYEKERTSHRR